ncbi:elongation factor 4 [Candidatus Gracilibacteria bacterium]|nr:elongation factor 4 [Candidatus Gracilibacteria bacterium]PIQ12320.1 MAG: elongation factor 4 [Candidatus Gracilibacteria bacterium CG18_big_fil_WC_8_21_14_2_50_38_16]PIQ41148.1 MAG: elongation factor 4 [Candidatus Gracilibacteria bacterium CG12_big_fil_rev_8_21_14_0_65_38_15]PIZ01925.1 MAG: elongation factor 4 [Candidatus Gracilibacteria bacterium CG_4_10_14_0_8_um_filter_38_28]PJC56912.1 MAG: elongation factor 4 [Candidatus Gracilibacteria bacterium CG_4_9_14_0_2_um_filter_38_7]
MTQSIRNFCIIAHIDHGKSTLADRMLEITGTIDKRSMHAQTLDTMDIEQERGITIKLTPVRMAWKGVELNLIDTPGHVDFQYEVSRSLASVEGAILVVDATQGIEAQTLSNVYLALENDLTIIPVLNKIDLPSADVERVSAEVISLLGCKKSDIISVSAKTGENVELVLDAVLEYVPEPKRLDKDANLVAHNDLSATTDVTKALIFDSQYDTYKGVVVYTKLFSGQIKKGDKLEFLNTGAKIEALEVGCFSPKYNPVGVIDEGEIGYVVTGLKSLTDARVGDTVFAGNQNLKTPIKGFKRITPYIFAGIYPVDTDEYPKLKESIEKLTLNDSSLVTENEVSPALGHGFRCGFLGLLHLDIVKERLWRDFQMDVIMTSPQVTYRLLLPGDKVQEYGRLHPELIDYQGQTCTYISVSNPEDLPKAGTYKFMEEPIAKVEMITPSEFIGNCMQLAQERRGTFIGQTFLDTNRVILSYEIPMSELIGDFYDDLKSLSSGYASLSYEFLRYQEDDLERLDILVAGERVDAFSMIVHTSRARYLGGRICAKLKEHIPKAQFAISIQAALGANIIAREDISAMRKDVTAKLYGGDITRKRKLLEKQKEGKKKMKQFGKVSIPSETFVNILKK